MMHARKKSKPDTWGKPYVNMLTYTMHKDIIQEY